MYKPGKGAFYATDLQEQLQARGITHLIFAGVTTEVRLPACPACLPARHAYPCMRCVCVCGVIALNAVSFAQLAGREPCCLPVLTLVLPTLPGPPALLQVCVQTSMREANDRGYECLLVIDATGKPWLGPRCRASLPGSAAG